MQAAGKFFLLCRRTVYANEMRFSLSPVSRFGFVSPRLGFSLLESVRVRSVVAAFAAGVFFFGFVSSEDPVPPMEDPVVFYNMIELVCAEGYHIQEYTTVTEDGYILKIYRIPNGKRRAKVPKRRNHYQYLHEGHHPDFADCFNDSLREAPLGPPVLLAHGLLSASDVWVLQGPKSALAFMLADKGYDVWFSNIRGNFYSRRHKTLKPSQFEFWDFSFHENGVYDMTATIDFVLSRSTAPKLSYVGHSMGTTMFFVMMSQRPEYKDKVKVFVGMTPVTKLNREHISSSRMNAFNSVFNLVERIGEIGVQEFLPRNHFSSVFARNVCWMGSPLQDFCYDLAFSFAGFHSKQFLRKKFVVYLSHVLGGSSVKTFKHFRQTLDAPYFSQFDYGPEENLRRYGRAEPPEYDVRNLTVPTALYYSKGDYIADERDVADLSALLPNVIEKDKLLRYSHLDYVWAYTAKDLVYGKIVEVVDKFRSVRDSAGT